MGIQDEIDELRARLEAVEVAAMKHDDEGRVHCGDCLPALHARRKAGRFGAAQAESAPMTPEQDVEADQCAESESMWLRAVEAESQRDLLRDRLAEVEAERDRARDEERDRVVAYLRSMRAHGYARAIDRNTHREDEQ